MTTDDLSLLLLQITHRIDRLGNSRGDGLGRTGYDFYGGGGLDKGSGTGDGWSYPSRHYRVPERLTEEPHP